MNPVDYAILAKRAYTDAPTVGEANSASRMHTYGLAHVFRGSDDAASWAHDFNVRTTDIPGLGKLHAGFWDALATILPACLALPAPKAIVGHSLGAAMAIIYAGVWALQGVIVPVYAFEPPRICGDDVLSYLLKNKQVPFYATRNGRDVVTQVPTFLTLPGPLTEIGTPLHSFDNADDHDIDRVIAALLA